MRSGELITRGTIWIAIAAYTLGCVVFAIARRQADGDRWARLAWTIGGAVLVAHFLAAFHFYHAWSQASAYSETARQTAAVVRLNWGGGLFINYAVAGLWAADVSWWWFAGVGAYRRRPWWITVAWHSFLIFILFNATVVFKDGLTRWIGLLVCLTLCLSWVAISRQRRSLSTA
ncbi:MAG TPA: hypothetical protein VLB87_09540 [Pyrinomonadaceae bacterium]|nr:hypothetical protein [Pyrinomonadaceae bacterium]